MWGLLATIAGILMLLLMSANITSDKFNEAIRKQHEQWEE